MSSPVVRLSHMRRLPLAWWVILTLGLAACSACPFCDTETRPETDASALAEAEETLDLLSAEILEGVTFEESVWEAPDSCAVAPFSPEQGEIGRALIRSYSEASMEPSDATPDSVNEGFSSFWTERDETVNPSSPDSPRGSVARVNGIGYDVVVGSWPVLLRAFTPCY